MESTRSLSPSMSDSFVTALINCPIHQSLKYSIFTAVMERKSREENLIIYPVSTTQFEKVNPFQSLTVIFISKREHTWTLLSIPLTIQGKKLSLFVTLLNVIYFFFFVNRLKNYEGGHAASEVKNWINVDAKHLTKNDFSFKAAFRDFR